MPYEMEHACRLMYPGDFTEFRSKASGKARLILGKRKGSPDWEVQAIRYPKDQWPEATAQASCQAHDGMFEAAVKVAEHTYGMNGIPEWDAEKDGELPAPVTKMFAELDRDPAKTYAGELKGVEIFSAGVWNGDPYTEGDLDAIVAAYPQMPRRPPVKLGHTEGQKFFGQPDGHPALGWVEKIYREGKKLLADLTGVPDALMGMIRSRAYEKVSAEIYWNYKLAEGTVLPRALKAVSLLGADMPAVSNLQDLQATLLGENDRIARAYGDDASEVKTYEIPKTEERSDAMAMDAAEKKTYDDKIAAAGTERDAAIVAKEAAEKRALEADLKVFSLELDGFVRQGKVLPAEVEGYKADFRAMGTGLRKYTENGKEVEKSWGQKKIEELQARPKLVEFREKAEGGDGEGGKKEAGGMSVSALTEKVMKERKCTYQEAQEAVRAEHPEMFRAYVTRKEGK